jgi:hypothetical protein
MQANSLLSRLGGGWVVGGWVAVEIENKANSVQLELELGLSLAIVVRVGTIICEVICLALIGSKMADEDEGEDE